jgi:hypothetical protein
MPRDLVQAVDVTGEQALPLIRWRIEDPAYSDHASGVDQVIDPAERIDAPRNCTANLSFVSHVGNGIPLKGSL